MQQRRLGSGGPEVSAIGLGCMGMSAFYGRTDEGEAIRTIHRALELGCNFLDTSDMYGPHTNERLVGKAIAGRRDEFVIATKFGIKIEMTDPPKRVDRRQRRSTCARPARPRCSGSASTTSTSTTSTASTRTRRSRRRSGRWRSSSPRGRSATSGSPRPAPRRSAAPTRCTRSPRCRPSTRCGRATSSARCCRRCASSGIGLVAYSPLGRGFLSGRFTSPDELDEGDFRRFGPRFTGENLEHNLQIVAHARAARRAARRHAGPAGARLGAAPGEDVVPIPGTKRVTYLEENLAAAGIELTAAGVGADRADAAVGAGRSLRRGRHADRPDVSRPRRR